MEQIRVTGYFLNGTTNNKIIYDDVGNKKNKIIKYINNEDNITLILNNNRITFLKNNKLSSLKYVFSVNKNNESYYIDNENNLKIYINVLTKHIKIKDNTIDIKFMIENYESKLYIKYEVI